MKRITANYVYTPNTGFLRFGIIVIDDNGKIVEVIDTEGQMQEIHSMEFHSGLIVNCRISNDDLLKFKGGDLVKLEYVFNKLFEEKPQEGVSQLTDIDYSSFSLKEHTTARILI